MTKTAQQQVPLAHGDTPAGDALSAGTAGAGGDRSQAFRGPIYSPPFGIPAAASVTPEMRNGLIQKITLNQATTINNPGSPKEGMFFTLVIRQPSSGGPHLVTWGSQFDWGDEGPPTLTTTASKYDIVSGLWVTTTLLAVSARTGFGP